MDPLKNQTIKLASVKNAVNSLANSAPTVKQELSAYQQNLSSPVETPSFQPTTRAAMGQMMTVMEQDPVRGRKLQASFDVLQNTKGSMYYNPYTKPTNQAVYNLGNLGYDVSNIDDNWYNNNAYLQSYYNPSSTTNNPTSPGKNATPEQTAGYNYYQVYQAKANTDKALAESAALRQELSYWANRKDLNYSDDEIIGMIDWKKYPTLVNMKETAAKGAPMELNSAVDMATDDWMYGVIWSARNDGGTGSVWKDMAMSANEQGNLWQANDEIAAKLDKSNKETYSPNSVGMTMNQEGLYFSRDSFDQGWVDDNMYRLNSNDETEVKYFTNVMKGEERTQSAESELDALNKKVDSWIARGVPAERALKMLENELGNGSYPTLNSMDEGRKYGNPVNLTRAVDYRKEDVQNRIRSECASSADKKDTTVTAGALFDMLYPSNFFEGNEEQPDNNKLPDIVKPSQQKWQRQPGSQIRIMKPMISQIDADVARAQDENVRGIGALLYDDMTPAEAAGVASWSTNSGTAIDSLTGLRNAIIQQRKNGDNSALEALTRNGGKRVANSYITGSLFNYKTINDYQNTQQQLAVDLAKEQDLISQLGDLQYMDIEINGKKGTYAQKTDYEFSLNDGIDGEATDYQIKLGETPDGQFYVEWVGEWNGEYYQEVNDQSRVQSVVDSDQAKKAIADADINREKANTARSNMYSGTTEESDDWNVVTVDGDKYQIELSDETESGIGSIAVWNEGMGAYQTIDGDWAAEIASSQEAQDFLKNHNLRAQNFTLANPLSASAESTYENVQDKVIELRQLQKQIEDEEDYLKTNAPDYEASLKEYDNAGLKMQIQGRILTNLGADTSDLVVAQIVMENMIPYTKYEPTVWDTLSTNNVYSTALRDIDAGVKTDMTRDELFAGAAESKVNIEKQIANLEYMKKYIEGNGVFDQYGVQLSALGVSAGYSRNGTGESIIGNIDRKIASLKRDLVDVDAFLLQQDKDFKSKAEAGRMLEFDTALQNGYVYGNDGYHTGDADEYFRMLDDGSIEYFYDEAADTEGTELEAYSPSSLIFRAGGMDMYNLLTEEEKDTYYYYLAEDERKAIDYINSLTDQTYGVLTTRRSEKLREDWANFTSEHFLLGNAAAIIMSPMASVMGGSYFAYSFITGKEFNPNASWMAVNNMRSTVREQSAEEIEKTFGEGSAAAKIAKFCYDVVVMRADSAMNAITFGNLIGDLFPSGEYTGTFGKMINEFASASPMGVSAMADAIAEAKTNGASDSQAYAIGGFTFLAETVTEAISLDNMREAFVLGEDFTVEGAKEFMKNWLTKAGVSEALGESFNDYVEKAVDEYYMGENSQHSRRVDEYRLLGYGKDEAEYLARQDEFGEIMYTALVSYLSPGLDVFSAGAGRYSTYRSIQSEMNRGGGNYTLEDARNGVIEQEVNARRAEDLARLEAEDRWNNTGIAPINYGAATEVAGELGFVEQKAKAQEKIDEAAAAVDFEILTDAQSGNWSAHDAGVAAVLDEQGTQASREMAQAAAANLHEVLGEERLAAEELEEVMYGAVAQGISTSTVKQAFMVAALGGDQSAVRQLMQSAAYQTATPDVKAAAIEQAFKKDVNVGLQQAVQQAVRDNRVATVEAELISKGLGKAVQEAEDKVTDAMQAQQKAEEMLATQREVEAAKAGEAEEATKNLIENPGDTNAVHRVQSTQQELRKASEVTHEYEMALAKQQEAVANATENAKRVKQETMAEIRQQAEAVVAQEDQVRAEEAAQQAEQERVAAEEQAKAQAEEDVRTGKAQEDEDMAKIDARIEAMNLKGEQAQAVRNQLRDYYQKMKTGDVDTSKHLTDAEAILAVNNMGRRLGVQIEIDENGELKEGQDGKYNSKQNRILLNKNLTVGQAMLEVAFHEITHSLEGTKSYAKYAKTVLGMMYKTDAELNKAIQDKISFYRDNGIVFEGDGVEDAKREIVADFAKNTATFANRATINRMLDEGLGGKIRNALHNINQFLKNARLEGQQKIDAENLRKAERLYTKAINERRAINTHPSSEQFSVNQFAQAAGLFYNEVNVYGNNGEVVAGPGLYTADPSVVGNNAVKVTKVTADMIQDTPVGQLTNAALALGTMSRETVGKIHQMFADLMTMCSNIQDSNLVWEIASATLYSEFSAIKANSDKQYSTTVDFGTICTKTQAVINQLSRDMLRLGRGLNSQEILEVYNDVFNADLKVPCPVCYVFSRWLGVPSLLENIRTYQNRFLGEEGNEISPDKVQERVDEFIQKAHTDYGIDGKFVETQAKAREAAAQRIERLKTGKDGIADVEAKIAGYKDKLKTNPTRGDWIRNLASAEKKLETLRAELSQAEADYDNSDIAAYAKAINKRKADIEKKIKDKLVKIEGNDKGKRGINDDIRDAIKEGKSYDKLEAKRTALYADIDDLNAQLREVDAYNWVTQALCKLDESGRRFVVDKEGFVRTKNEILLDLNRTGEFAKDTKNWTYRSTRGAGMGKAILPYSGATIGDSVLGTAARTLANPFLDHDANESVNSLKSAIKKAYRQNMIGGQRFQSTSDFRPEWGLDYIMTFIEQQAIGSCGQLYTKVKEFVPLAASAGIDTNCSIMPYANGWHEPAAGEIESMSDADRRSRVVTFEDENGNEHTVILDFSDVTGMEYESAKELAKQFDSVQMIMVGINDVHIRACLAGEEIDFVIPWHASGNTKSQLQNMMKTVNETLTNSSDYTKTQSDQIANKKALEAAHGKLERGEDLTAFEQDLIHKEQMRNARTRLLTGATLTATDMERIAESEFLTSLYERFEGKTLDGKELPHNPDYWIQLPGMEQGERVTMTSSQAEQIFPYEYWDTTLTKDQADENGWRFVRYCQELGLTPRFSGANQKDEKTGAVTRFGNFSGAIYDESGNIVGYDRAKMAKGYWKTLIDRKMYDNQGNYRAQQKIDASKIKVGDLVQGENGLVHTDSNIPDSISGAGYRGEEAEAKYRKADEFFRKRIEEKAASGDDKTREQAQKDLEQIRIWDEAHADTREQYDLSGQINPNLELTEGQMMQMLSDSGVSFDLDEAINDAIADMTDEEVLEYLGLDLSGLTDEQVEEEAEETIKTITASVQDIKDEFDPTIYNGRLYIRPETLDYWLSDNMFGNGTQNYSRAYIAMMNPADFVRMTTMLPEVQQRIYDETGPLNNSIDREGKEASLDTNARRQPIQLKFNEDTKKIDGHEGRHRSVALARAGVTQVPVVLVDERESAKYNKTAKDTMTLEGQNPEGVYGMNNGNTYTFHDVIPINEAHRDELFSKFTASDEDRQAAEEGGQRIVQYSLNDSSNMTEAEMEQFLNDAGIEVRKSVWSDNPVVRFDSYQSQDVVDALEGIGMKMFKDDYGWGMRVNRGVKLTQDEVRQAIMSAMPEGTPAESAPVVTTEAAPETPDIPLGERQWGANLAQTDNGFDESVKEWIKYHNKYLQDTNAEQINRAIKWIHENKMSADSDGYNESLEKVCDDNFDYRSADGQARMIAVMAMAVVKNDIPAQTQLADAYNHQGTTLGQALQARKLFRMMTPEGRIASIVKMMKNMQAELDAKGFNKKLKFSDWIYRAAAFATEEGDMQKVQNAAAHELAEQIPANWRDRVRSLRMLSMLANPRTHIRNFIGNAMFIPAVGMKNKIAALMELGRGKGNRTKTLSPFLSAEARRFARMDAQAMKDTLKGEAKYNEDSAVQRMQKPFRGLLQAIIDLNSNALEGEDWIFLKGHYRRALGGWMMANGYTAEQLYNNKNLLDEGRAYAVLEAQKATYRDFNKLAQTLNKVSRDGGVAGFLVDAVLPFKKTPANILRRGIEYSPVSIMRSLTTDLYHLKQWNDAQNGKLNAIPDKALSPTQFIDRLCSGLSGTVIMAIGALLCSAGIVSVGYDDDDEFEKAKGGQPYAFRFNIGGQDFTFTMDWAAPMSMPFFVGAAVQEQLANQDGFSIEALVDAFGNIMEPVFNLSMLDGVNTLFKTSQYDDTNTLTQIGAKIATNYITSYVPSIFGATARTIDDTKRKAFVKSGEGTGVLGTARYAWEQTQNKIPWWSKSNIPSRDIWGNPETSSLAERLLENFVLPGYVSEYRDDPILNEMERVYQITGDKGLVPSDPPKSFTYNKQKYVLEAEQWDTYKKVRGQTAYKVLNALIQSDAYKNADTATQNQMLSDAWSYADKVGKAAIVPDYELPKMSESPEKVIAKEATITMHKNEMIKALEAEDYDAYGAMVQALRDEGVEEGDIKKKIGDTYRDRYKNAYKNNDDKTMAEIEDILDMTGFEFDIYGERGWIAQVDDEED